MSSEFATFLTEDAFRINQDRQEHLASLELQIAGKRVLEVGAGIGLHTRFFEALGCSILTTDGRQENVNEIRRRYPHRHVARLNFDDTFDLTHFGEFDIIYCYGLLYHLSDPEQALSSLSKVCREMILLETCVTPGDEIEIYPILEDQGNYNQACSGLGCRPTRPWVMENLKKYFGFSYVSKYQPCHPDFDLDWQHPVSKLLHRSIFVGSKQELLNPKLLEKLPERQSYDPALQKIWINIGCNSKETELELPSFNTCQKNYTFEPNLKLAAQLTELVDPLPNYAVIPAAVSTHDGISTFYLNASDATSSLLPFNPERLEQWIGNEELHVEKVTIVPTIRLDTFLESLGIEKVDFLKIDAQGADFDVVLSAGKRIKDITKIKLEVAITPTQLYAGAHDKAAVVSYLTEQGFVLIEAEKQSNDQEENLTFIRSDQLLTLPDLARHIPALEQKVVLDLASQLAFVRPLKPYPGWRFNIEWDSLNKETQLRQAIWEYFRTNQIGEAINFLWYHDLSLYLHLGNDLSSQLFIAGCYEPNELYFLSQILEPGMTFVDVGANDGLYSLFASRYVGENGTVLSFEPSQREFNNLKTNIELNQIQNIRPLQLAVSNTNGDAALKVANYEHAGQNTLGDFVHQGVFCTQTEAVSVRRLDDVVAEFKMQRIDVIKLDTEGAELAALQGCQSVLQQFHPLLILELSDDALRTQGSSAEAVLEFLRSLGYTIFSVGQFTGVPLQSTEAGTLSSNIVAAHPNRVWRGLTESEQMQQLQIELNQTQTQLNQTQSTLAVYQADLQQAQTQIQGFQTELHQTQSQLQQTKAEAEQLQQQLEAQLQASKTQVEALQSQLQKSEQQSETLRDIITAMESSKFWQLRNTWNTLKQKVSFWEK